MLLDVTSPLGVHRLDTCSLRVDGQHHIQLVSHTMQVFAESMPGDIGRLCMGVACILQGGVTYREDCLVSANTTAERDSKHSSTSDIP